jgi:SAM-dependent methyltransferase
MVLMDAADGAGLLREAGRALRPGGRFVATLLHPCFEPPLGADWAEQEVAGERRLVHRLWRYRPAYAAAERLGRDQPTPIMRFHRPLEWYATHLRGAGLLIDRLDEPPPDTSLAAGRPASYERERAIPPFLVIGALKQEAT